MDSVDDREDGLDGWVISFFSRFESGFDRLCDLEGGLNVC
jgi:hypothetical protein